MRSILAGLGQSEEHSPKHAFCCCTDRQQHLGKGQDIEGYAAHQDDDTSPERKGLQPLFNLHAHSKLSFPAAVTEFLAILPATC